MSVVRCPRCRDEVTVPSGATSRALVRCPLCLEQYLLSEALANAPPPLIIIGGEVPQAVLAQSPPAGHDYQLSDTFSHSPDSHWGHATAATLAPRVSTVRAGRRPRKREPSMVLLALNYVGGALLGLFLAPIILWWIFRVDPVDIGPTVAAYVPWAVPPQFRGRATIPPPDYEPSAQRSRPRPKIDARTEEAPILTRASADEFPSLPESTESAQPLAPAASKSESAAPRPPIPDLKDLIP